ncbi:ATP synthase-coupling factor 6, mitochondrial isoform X3 [Aquarana catesbeiana]
MVLQHLFRLSSVFRSTISVHLRRNIGLTAIAFNKAKELDPIQKLFVDKIRDYRTKSQASGGTVDAGPEYQKDLTEDINKLQRLYGGGDLEKFPEFRFEDEDDDQHEKNPIEYHRYESQEPNRDYKRRKEDVIFTDKST